MSGHTQRRGNAVMITSTITVVLFTNVVKFLIHFKTFTCCKTEACSLPAYHLSRCLGQLQVCGLLTKPLVRWLLPQHTHIGSIMSSELLSSEMSLAMPLLTNGDDPKWDMAGDRIPRRTVLRMLLMTPVRSVHYYWRMFDDSFMRPVFGGRGFVPLTPGSPNEDIVHQSVLGEQQIVE